jgi:hypothetical protein
MPPENHRSDARDSFDTPEGGSLASVEDPEGPFIPVSDKKIVYQRIVYEDFFRIIAGRFLADHQGRKTTPRVVIWHGDVSRLQDQINPNKFRWKKFGRHVPKNQIRFQDIKSHEVKLDFLWRHTHWGNKLQELCKEEKDLGRDPLLLTESGMEKPPTTARALRSVITAFFEGKSDPRVTRKKTEELYHSDRKPPDRDTRSRRFLEMLKTVDGVFAQRFCAYPNEVWTYEKYDIFVLGLIWELISDEFLDGQLSAEALELDTRYSELKLARKTFKSMAGTETVSSIATTILFNKRARWLRKYLLPLYKGWDMTEDYIQKVYLHGVLCQTRCAGKPPPLAKLQTKLKFIQTVLVEDDTNPVKLKIVSQIMAELISELPDHTFAGLSTKAGVTATTSATWEHTQAEEGTLQSLQDICKDRALGVKAQVYNLETGTFLHYLDDNESEGTYIFWRCFENVIRMTPDERKIAALVITDEPGKNRSVTKAVACVKIVFDFVNKICSIPLERGFESSHSGMRKANHMWNFFKEYEKAPLKDVLFSEKSRKETQYNGTTRVEVEYEDVFAVSTDYETATDYLSHKIGKVIAYPWMVKCGIPKILRDLVCEIAFESRPIRYTGNFGIGELIKEEGGITTRQIRTKRGVLMGDPLTKVVLHFTNIVSRRLSWRIYQNDFLQKVFKSSLEFEKLSEMIGRSGISLMRVN